MAGDGLFPFSSDTSLGWTNSATSTIAQSYGTLQLSGLSIIGTATATQFLGPDGSALFPLFGFSAETRLGFIRSTASTIQITFGQFVVNSGSVARPGLATNSETSLGFYRSAVSTLALSYGALALPSGSAVTPSHTFSSESSLGWYRFGANTMAQSLGTLNLASNAVRLSMRTIAASAVTASAAKTNVAIDEVVFTVGGASGASLCIMSGGTLYYFNSFGSAPAA